jgi:DNA repair protein SbcC/Rad50
MKILKLRFKNLNSLAGEWSIDFSSPDYISDGIFAIAGPTGAGKSTILDAICLALYGRTPRLKNISKATNEIMSRQKGVCFAEVVFETDQGRFRAYWSQRRAREKAEGALQNPEHEISNAETKELLASQLTTTEIEVEKRTGMDYDRFVQSMLLAQGGFAAFLQASAGERAPILEQITGTEIYSDISRHVFERQRAEKAKLDLLVNENKGIIILNPDEEAAIIKSLGEKNENKDALAAERDKLEASISWLKKTDSLKSDLAAIEKEEAYLNNEITEFKPGRLKLKNARRAADLDGEFATLTALRNQQKNDNTALADLSLQTTDLKIRLETSQKEYDSAQKLHSEARIGNESLLKLAITVRSLDQEIAQSESGIKDIEKAIVRYKGEINTETGKKESFEKSIAELNGEKEKTGEYLKTNQADSALVTELAGIRATAEGLNEAGDSLSAAEKNLESSLKSLADKKLEIEGREKELTQAIEKAQKDSDAINAAMAEISLLLGGLSHEELQAKRDKLILHLADLRKISSLAAERKLLEDNKPCPLCGSLHHPYAEGNIPVPTETERELEKLDDAAGKIKALTRKVSDMQEREKMSSGKVTGVTNNQMLARQKKGTIEETIKHQSDELEKCKNIYGQKSANLKQFLDAFGISAIPCTRQELTALLAALDMRKSTWLGKQKRNTDIDGEINLKKANLKASDEIIRSKNSEINSKSSELESLRNRLAGIKSKRSELFGDRNADQEEERSRNALQKAEDDKTNAQELLQLSRQKLEENSNLISGLQRQISERRANLESAEEKFAVKIVKSGFADEMDFISSRLTVEDREHLENEASRLDTGKTALEARKAGKKRELEEETAKNLTEETVNTLLPGLDEKKTALSSILQEIGALNQKITSNNEARAKGEQIGQRIHLQNKLLERWSSLNNLIGSADGRKYRNFAQGLTFEIMVSYANMQLARLSDRYLLMRDRNEPLELNVIDNYQAGEIRTTKNLSGGESFIVSLALALGLSRMSGRNVRVDSLFLDEGFGSLDEETLETALGTLASLRQDGKMIGVISHVGAMKDRINTKIIVQPLREGRSILSGPGCQEIRPV